MPLSIYLFGTPRFERRGQSIRISRRNVVALASYLAITGRPHSRESLATLFWPEKDYRAALKNLRRELARLRNTLGSGFVTVDRTQIGVTPEADVWVDVHQFRRHLTHVREHRHALDQSSSRCLNALMTAADLYTDDFMAGFNLPNCPAFDEWQFFQREHLRRGLSEILHQLTSCYVERGEYERGLQYGQRWLALDPLHEPAHRALMRIYVQTGQPAAAVRQYRACVRTLEEELGISPASETTDLYETIRAGRFLGAGEGRRSVPVAERTQPAIDGRPRPPHKLPVYPTPFVGRTQELTMILLRLQEPACRLLTLVGPGGIGKTRLAVEASRRLLATADMPFADGVFFVSLASVTTPEGIPYAIVDALGEHFYGTAPTKQKLLHYLRTKQLLLVLDNVEHLQYGRNIITDILAASPGVKLLVTSRQALNIQGEWLHSVGGMSVPPQYGHTALPQRETEVREYDAVEVFEECARRVKSDFRLADEEEQVVRICRLVEGVPLAIELAAAWLTVLPVQDVADQLERGLDILTSRQRDIAERHRSMRAVLEQTWVLLDAQERDVLERLSVFRGGFTVDAARSVARATLPILAALVEKSLIRIDATGRYRMHELLRQYAEESLGTAGTADDAHVAHAAYFLNVLHERETDLKGRRQLEALAEIESDLDNVRVAWQGALERRDVSAIDAIDRALDSLYLFFDMQSLQREGATLLQEAERKLGRSSMRLYGRVLARLAMLQTRYVRGGEDVRGSIREAMSIARRYDDPSEIAFCLAAYGHFAVDVIRNFPTGVRYFQRSLDYYTELDDTFEIAHTTHLLGYCHLVLTGPEEAARLLRLALHLGRQIGDKVRAGLCLAGLSMLSLFLGEYAAAAAYAEETSTVAAETGNRATLAQARALLALTCFLQGKMDQARTHAEASLVLARESSFPTPLIYALIALSTVENVSGNVRKATRLADEALSSPSDPYGSMLVHWAAAIAHCSMQDYAAVREHVVTVLTLAQQQRASAIVVLTLPVAAILQSKRGRHEEAIRLLALASTHPLAETGWLERWPLLSQLHTILEVELGKAAYNAGWQRGTKADLDTTVGRLLHHFDHAEADLSKQENVTDR